MSTEKEFVDNLKNYNEKIKKHREEEEKRELLWDRCQEWINKYEIKYYDVTCMSPHTFTTELIKEICNIVGFYKKDSV